MTQPSQLTAPTVESMEEMDAAALAYELEAEESVTAELAAAVAAFTAALLAAYVAGVAAGATGYVLSASLAALAERMLAAITPDMRPELARRVSQGVKLGAEQSLDLWDQLDPAEPDPARFSDPELTAAVATADQRARDTLEGARTMAQVLDLSQGDNVITVAAKAGKAVTDAKAATRWAANRAVNAGAELVARENGWRLLWVGERNACLKCLAYFGHVVTPGTDFPVGLTFGSRPSTLGGVPYAPLHPNCRCRCVVWPGGDVISKGNDMPTGVAREARRTVLRGWSDYDSLTERLKAADLLLNRGANLPKTVVARAARDVKRGAFSQRHRPLTNLNA